MRRPPLTSAAIVLLLLVCLAVAAPIVEGFCHHHHSWRTGTIAVVGQRPFSLCERQHQQRRSDEYDVDDNNDDEFHRRKNVYGDFALRKSRGIDRRGMIIATVATAGGASSNAFADDSSGAIVQSSLQNLPPSSLKTSSNGGTAPPSSSVVDGVVTVPLEYIPKLGAYIVRFTLFGERFGAIVDTGSPFLTVPSYCKAYRNVKFRWGCYRPELTSDSGYANTVEGFDNNYGTVVWRKAGFSFGGEEYGGDGGGEEQSLVFGVLDGALMDGPGGVFLGLIKETDRWIRPSFLGQTGYRSFCIDLRSSDAGGPKLVLSKKSMIHQHDNGNTDDNGDGYYIPLVRDLKRRYKAPVVHYTAKASSFIVNGLPLLIDDAHDKPLFVIFDTGVTGMVVSQELFDGRNLQARKNREKTLWGSVEVSFATTRGTRTTKYASGSGGGGGGGEEVTLSAMNPVTTPLGKATPWRGFRGNLVVLGLAFLNGCAMTVDIEDSKLQFSK